MGILLIPTIMWIALILFMFLTGSTLGQRCEELGVSFESKECYQKVRNPGSPIWRFVDNE